MQDILFLTQRIPYPPNKGDKLRAFHTLRHLSTTFRVHLGCFIDDPVDEVHVAALREYCASVFTVPLWKPLATLRGLAGLARGRSLSESYFKDQRMVDWVKRTASSSGAETIFVFCSAMAPYALPMAGHARIILDMVDVDSEKWGAYGRQASWPLSALYAREQQELLRLERHAALHFDRSFFVSSEEARAFVRLAPEAADRVDHFDNGVDLRYFDPAQTFPNPFPAGCQPIVFTGMMDYRPNIEAVEWFAKSVLPLVRAVSEKAEFWVIGANPSAGTRRLVRNKGVHVSGRVPDVRPYLSHAACVVAPLRMARGVQNKVLEALAMARPTVVTPQAHEGLTAAPDRELLIAETPQEFASAVGAILAGLHVELGRRARMRVEEDHNWTRNLSVLDHLLRDASSGEKHVRNEARAVAAQ